jgi:hypothetical protein
VHGIVSNDVCRHCSPKKRREEVAEHQQVIDDDESSEYSDSESDGYNDSEEDDSETEDSDGENSDLESEGENSDLEPDEEDAEDTSLWKKIKRKALEINIDDKSILKDVIQIYLGNVELKLLLDKDKLHKKLKQVIQKKMKEMDKKSAFDFAWRRYRPAIEKAVFDLYHTAALTKIEKMERNKGTIFEHECLEEDDCSSQLWHEYILPQITDMDAAEVYANGEKRKEVMKNVKSMYLKAIYMSATLDKDYIHRLIRKGANKLLKDEEMDEKDGNEDDIKSTYYACALERLGMIKHAIQAGDDEEDNDSIDGNSSTSTSSSSSSDSDDDDDKEDTLFVDLFNECIEEMYPEDDLDDKAREILNNDSLMEMVVEEVMKKYRITIKLKKKMERSRTHETIERTKQKLEDVEDSDSDDDNDWDHKDMWGDAIQVRKMTIINDIKKNYPDEPMDTSESEEPSQEYSSRKRHREDDDDETFPDPKRQKPLTPHEQQRVERINRILRRNTADAADAEMNTHQ